MGIMPKRPRAGRARPRYVVFEGALHDEHHLVRVIRPAQGKERCDRGHAAQRWGSLVEAACSTWGTLSTHGPGHQDRRSQAHGSDSCRTKSATGQVNVERQNQAMRAKLVHRPVARFEALTVAGALEVRERNRCLVRIKRVHHLLQARAYARTKRDPAWVQSSSQTKQSATESGIVGYTRFLTQST